MYNIYVPFYNAQWPTVHGWHFDTLHWGHKSSIWGKYYGIVKGVKEFWQLFHCLKKKTYSDQMSQSWATILAIIPQISDAGQHLVAVNFLLGNLTTRGSVALLSANIMPDSRTNKLQYNFLLVFIFRRKVAVLHNSGVFRFSVTDSEAI